MAIWNRLIAKFGIDKLNRHEWEWREGKNWVPHYTYQPVLSITDVWKEWTEGLNGYLSVRQLNEEWGAKWRRNAPPVKVENTRRKRIVDLMNSLGTKQGWNPSLVQKFLTEHYGKAYTAHTFSDYLSKAENKKAVMEAAKKVFS